MGKPIDLVGKSFGRWTVLRVGQTNTRKGWDCVCTCGSTATVPTSNLTGGKSTCCMACANRTHGHSRHGPARNTYRIWWAMVQRCRNPRNESWELYGGRGISVCPAWVESFEAFLADMGVKPPGLSLDRQDNDGNYEPGNCRWATTVEQSHNSRAVRWVSFNGEKKVISEWARYFGLKVPTLFGRIREWGEAEAMRRSLQEMGARHADAFKRG